MSKLHFIAPTVPQEPAQVVRLGTNAGQFNTDDVGKLVKLSAESQYVLCAAGDPIEGVIAAIETAKSGGHSIGSIFKRGVIFALADGLQATPGVGAIAVGDYVVAGSITALGTKLGSFPKVCKATQQPGITEAAAVGDVNDQLKVAMFAWRVVSLGSAGTGAVGTTVVIERL
jgi:hypothetical protein